MRRGIALGLVCLLFAISGANCWELILPKQTREAGLQSFSSAEELRSYLVDQATARSVGSGGGWPFLFNMAAPMAVGEDAIAGGNIDDGSGEAGDSFSTTNIQELGVDESDVVKNDGQTIYVLEGDTIHIVQATPADGLTELASVEVASSGDSLYLRDNKLIALSQQNTFYVLSSQFSLLAEDIEPVGGDWNDGSQVTVTVIDVSDPANPVIDTTIKFEGQLATSRLIDNRLYIVLTTLPRLPDNPVPSALEKMTLDQWIPDYQMTSSDGSTSSGDIASWQNFFRPIYPDGYGITTVVTVDVDNPAAEFEATAISADAGTIYASTQALYVTDTKYDFEDFTSHVDTIIHKLAFDQAGTNYVASGMVPGRLLNQYSLGEYEDYLRIATTVDNFGVNGGQPTNSVYVLGESGTSLQIVGSVEGLAPGEQIYAVRFIGKRGFLVTFKRVDPLFILDLSDPTNPQVLGKLKVPGYSDHIQLLDQNHLLTIGKDAEDMGTFAWIQGVQLSIFDVTDPANPQLLHKEIIGGRGTHSEANYNPKAFNYFAPLNALAFPIDLYGGDTTGAKWGKYEFTGLLVYRVTVEDGFERLGGISSEDNSCWGYYGFTRGVFIGDSVYLATESGVKAASLDDIGTAVGEVQFSGTEQPDCWSDEPVIALPAGEGLR